jgi:hypothetical protein
MIELPFEPKRSKVCDFCFAPRSPEQAIRSSCHKDETGQLSLHSVKGEGRQSD